LPACRDAWQRHGDVTGAMLSFARPSRYAAPAIEGVRDRNIEGAVGSGSGGNNPPAD